MEKTTSQSKQLGHEHQWKMCRTIQCQNAENKNTQTLYLRHPDSQYAHAKASGDSRI